MKKVAKLVYVSLMTRVVVDENATEQDIMELAIPRLSDKLIFEPLEHIESIEDDEEVPYGEAPDDKEEGGEDF
jgi:hypothetical protein